MLTPQQSRTLDFIKEFMANKAFAPTTGEIAKGIGIASRGVVHRYLTALAREKYIELIPNRRRNIALLEVAANQSFQLPLYGKIAAGCPIEAVQMMDTLDVAGAFLGSKNYALLVQGDSMIDEGILHGDYVIIDPSHSAKNGDIVVALVDGQEATLKRVKYYSGEPQRVTLVPANEHLKPIDYDSRRVQIQGVFRGLLRLHK